MGGFPVVHASGFGDDDVGPYRYSDEETDDEVDQSGVASHRIHRAIASSEVGDHKLVDGAIEHLEEGKEHHRHGVKWNRSEKIPFREVDLSAEDTMEFFS